MSAVAATIGLFAFWFLAGYGLLALLQGRRNSRRNALLAPAAGISVSVLCVFTLSRWGLPVGSFAVPLAGLLAVGSGLAIRRFRGGVDCRSYAPFAAILAVALVLNGWPLFRFGFDWVSFCHHDMPHYALSAQYFQNHGYFDPPAHDDLFAGRDYGQTLWYMHVNGGVRTGANLLLAAAASVLNVTAHQVYMPLMVSFYLALVSAVGALAYRSCRSHRAMLIAAAATAISGVGSGAVVHQMMPQVIGLTLLVASVEMLLRPQRGPMQTYLRRHVVVSGITVAALLVVYPEVTPFLGGAFVAYHAWRTVRRGATEVRQVPIFLAANAVVVFVLLRAYAVTAVEIVFAMKRLGMNEQLRQGSIEMFPFYLVPSGLGGLWGLIPLSNLPGEPFLSASILAGAILSFLLLTAAGVMAWHGRPAAFVVLLMAALGFELFRGTNAYGLFKLAMFIQPFLAICSAAAFVAFVKFRIVTVGILALLGAANSTTQQALLRASCGDGTCVEVPDASALRVNAEFARVVSQIPPNDHVVFDSDNLSMATCAAYYLRGRTASFPANDFFVVAEDPIDVLKKGRRDDAATASKPGAIDPAKLIRRTQIDLHDPDRPGFQDSYVRGLPGIQFEESDAAKHLVISTGSQHVLNRSRFPAERFPPFVARPWQAVQNHLILLNSELGTHADVVDRRTGRRHIGLGQLERDPVLSADRTMSGFGRHLLMQVVRPTPGARLLIDVSASYRADGENRLPPAVVIGDRRYALPLIGRGAARVCSEPLTVQTIAGRHYLALDFGEEGVQFPQPRSGLMKLWGTDVPYDSRWLVGFARDLTLVSAEEWAERRPPPAIRSFPDDLTDPNVEFSGLYEHGWASEAAFVRLSQPAGDAYCVVRGTVPQVADADFKTVLTVRLDDEQIARQELGVGEFAISVPCSRPRPTVRRVELRFSHVQRLTPPDTRSAAALLTFVGFEVVGASATPAADTAAKSPPPLR